jgi:hypothetical protein
MAPTNNAGSMSAKMPDDQLAAPSACGKLGHPEHFDFAPLLSAPSREGSLEQKHHVRWDSCPEADTTAHYVARVYRGPIRQRGS